MNDNIFEIKQMRNSNLELFRIITMILIVAHHYVVNSGLTAADGPIFINPLSLKSLFLLTFGMWGKIGINCFVLITGYFMCTTNITLKKFLKLVLEIYFYRIIFFIIFAIAGYQEISLTSIIKLIMPVSNVTTSFTDCYILFFLFIPFLNILIKNLNKKMHIYLVLLCILIYVILGTLPKIDVAMNYVSWFIVLYFIASYIRLYPIKILENTKVTGGGTICLVIISIISVIVMQWIDVKFGREGLHYFWVADSNKLLAVLVALWAFCFFKNIQIKPSKLINTVAASTFGVLLIHANSDAMRQWLWKDTLHNVEMYNSNLTYVHAIVSVLGVFIICTLIDIGRRKLLEEPFFRWFDKKKALKQKE